MAFNLIVTTRKGRTFKALRGPYETREGTRATARNLLRDPQHCLTIDEANESAAQVVAAPLGETVTNEKSGLSFRTEEA